MNSGTFASPYLLTAAAALGGLVFGLIYFRMLRWSVDLFTGGGGWTAAAGLTLARIAGAVIFLIVLARLGTAPLLAGFLCFLLARMIAVRPGTGPARRTG